jgi:hypothetical protein
MELYGYTHHSYAVGVTLLLAVMFVSACSSSLPSPYPARIAATVQPTVASIRTPLPASPTTTAALAKSAAGATSSTVLVQGSATISSPTAAIPLALKSSNVKGLTTTAVVSGSVGSEVGLASPSATSGAAQTDQSAVTSTRTVIPATVEGLAVDSAPSEQKTAGLADATAVPEVGNDDRAGVDVYETIITLPTYPFREYLVEQIDPVYNMPVLYFNRTEYEIAEPTPTPVDYTGVVLENPYLRLVFIPELGGRLYSAVVKATDQEIFYHNPVVKPSRYGGLQPYEANWWLATGGMEWAYPTQEHGYRFGIPWDYTVSHQPDGATITLSDLDRGRVGMEVSISLPNDSPVFTVAPSLVNDGPDIAPVQLWTNAALTLAPGSMSPDTQFIVPTEVITVHSRGEAGWTIPEGGDQATWPLVGDTDLSDYSQWADYLGFFVSNQDASFVGAYNQTTDLGIVRLAALDPLSGSGKLFAFGRDFPDRSYTDDNSQYFEIWGGANSGFWSKFDISLPVGQVLAWQESWWPVSELGGLTWATPDIAIYLAGADGHYTLSAVVSRPRQVELQITAGPERLLEEPFWADPAEVLTWDFNTGPEAFSIEFLDTGGLPLLEYQVE